MRVRVLTRILRIVLATVGGGIVLASLAGCSGAAQSGFLPGEDGLTSQTDGIRNMWTVAWIVLLLVGVVVWGLIIWSVIAYRRRKGETGLPPQLRYNMPIEIFYTLVPLILILGFGGYTMGETARLEARASTSDTDVVHIQAIGQQWTWTFNYTDGDAHEPDGLPAQYVSGSSYDRSELPTLWLPIGKTVEVELNSRDVAHSFWVPSFLYKKDMIPGRTNYWTFTPQVVGTYNGTCAELCGEYHSMMLFNLKVVSVEEYEAHVSQLRDEGYSGTIAGNYDRNQNVAVTSSGSSSAESE